MLSITPGKPLINGSYGSFSLCHFSVSCPSAVSHAVLEHHFPPLLWGLLVVLSSQPPSEDLPARLAALPLHLLTDFAFSFHHSIKTVFSGRPERACPIQCLCFPPNIHVPSAVQVTARPALCSSIALSLHVSCLLPCVTALLLLPVGTDPDPLLPIHTSLPQTTHPFSCHSIRVTVP